MDALRLGHASLALGHRALDLDRGLDGSHDVAELDDRTVTFQVDEAPPCRASTGPTSSFRIALRRVTVPAASHSMSRL